MAKSATITLTTAGADTGPFDLYSNADSYTTPFETNISKGSLLGGYTSNLIPDSATVVRVKSTDNCINYIDLDYPPTAYEYAGCGVSNSSVANACADAGSNPKTLYSDCSSLSSGCFLYYNSDLTNAVTELFVYADFLSWDMSGGGEITGLSSTQC